MPINQDERRAILDEVTQTWRDLQNAIQPLDAAQLTAPGVVDAWSVKDVMVHITAWETKVINEIETIEGGGTFREPSDVDAFNAEVVRRSADRDLADVREDFEATHAALMELLEVTPALSRELVAGDTYGHYPEHTAQIRAWAARSR